MTTDETSSRSAAFINDVSELKTKTSGNANTEKTASTVGIVLMVASIVVGLGSFVQAGNMDNALDQNELVILGLACVSMAIVGATLWLRTAMVRFMRFWMLRNLYEGQAHLDQVVRAINTK